MKRVENFISNKKMMIFILLFALFQFLIGYLPSTGLIKEIEVYPVYALSNMVYSVMIFVLLVCSKDTYNAIFAGVLYTFTLTPRFNFWETPTLIVYPCVLAAFGIIINTIRFRPKFKLGKYTAGIGIMCFGLSLGGLFSKLGGEYVQYKFAYWQPLVMLAGSVCIVLVMSFVISTPRERTFEDIVRIMLYVAFLLILESVFFYLYYPATFVESIKVKALDLGWGVSNNIALILLMCLPFALYYPLKNVKKYWYHFIYYLAIMITIFITVSKGSVIAAIIGTVLAFIIFFVKSNNKKVYLYLFVALFAVSVASFLVLFFSFRELFDTYLSHWEGYRGAGRTDIYKAALDIWKNNKLFGIGIFGSWGWSMEAYCYPFAHDTFIEILMVSGIFGMICFMYHMVDKYTRVLYKPNNKKLIMFLSFLIPGLYGLVDISYLYAQYMILLFVEMALFDKEIENEKIKYLF